jgi:putative inorganic carbon (hco3(-)) transporter
VIESSYILKSIRALWLLLTRVIIESVILRSLVKSAHYFLGWIRNSFIVQRIIFVSPIDRLWKASTFHRGMIWLIDLPYNVLSICVKRWGIVFEHSLVLRLLLKAYQFISSRIHIFLGLFILILSIIPYPYWNNLYALAGIMFLFLVTLTKKRPKMDTNVYLILFILAVTCAFIFSVNARLSFRFFIFYLNCFLLVYITVAELDTKEKFETFMRIALLGVFITGVYGIYQNYKGIPILASQVDTSIDSNLVGRVYSTIGNANNYAELLVMFFPFFATLFFNAKKIQHKAVYVAMAIPCTISLLLTYSRSSWIGLVVAIGIFVLLKEWRLIPVFGIIGLVIFPFLPLSITSRIMTIFSGDTSTNMRFGIWKQTMPLIREYWSTGIGLGQDVFIALMKNYPTLLKAVHAHNIYLQLLIETGILGLLSFIALKIHLFKETVVVILNKKIDMAYKNHIIAGIASIFGLLVVALVEYIWHDHRIMLIYWLMVGLVIATLRNAKEALRSSSSPKVTRS